MKTYNEAIEEAAKGLRYLYKNNKPIDDYTARITDGMSKMIAFMFNKDSKDVDKDVVTMAYEFKKNKKEVAIW